MSRKRRVELKSSSNGVMEVGGDWKDLKGELMRGKLDIVETERKDE